MKKSFVFGFVWARRSPLWINLGCLTALFMLSAGVCQAQLPGSAEGWVVLAVDDYRALRQAAFPTERDPEPPPVEATLTRIDYEMKIDGELASGVARLTI